MSLFKTDKTEHLNIIQCPSALDAGAASEFAKLAPELVTLSVKAHVLDFHHCQALGPEMSRHLIKFKRDVGATDVQIFSINLPRALLKQIKESGLDSVFNPIPDLNAVKVKLGLAAATGPAPSQATASVEFIKVFVSAVQIAISTQASTPLTAGKPYTKKEPHKIDIGIAGVISLVSTQFAGTISLLFPAKVFMDIYTNMLGEPLESITPESEDAAAELLNIIFGLAKMKLNNEKGFTVQKAIPTVLAGDKLHVATSKSGSVVVLPFETKAGPFFVEVTFEQFNSA